MYKRQIYWGAIAHLSSMTMLWCARQAPPPAGACTPHTLRTQITSETSVFTSAHLRILLQPKNKGKEKGDIHTHCSVVPTCIPASLVLLLMPLVLSAWCSTRCKHITRVRTASTPGTEHSYYTFTSHNACRMHGRNLCARGTVSCTQGREAGAVRAQNATTVQ